MSAILLRRMLAANASRLLAVAVGMFAWGFVLPVVYATFGAELRRLVEGGYFANVFDLLSAFGGGSIFSLDGSIAIGLVHPIPIALAAVFAIGIPVGALAGERQRGTLEVLLSRPVSRRRLVATVAVATSACVLVVAAADLAGILAGSAANGVAGELHVDRLLLAWANLLLLFAALAAVALAASASSDRVGPALGPVLAFTILSYAVEFLGTIWPNAAGLRPWSLFHYFQPAAILGGTADPADLVVLGGVAFAALGLALWEFPRRDLAAPS